MRPICHPCRTASLDRSQARQLAERIAHATHRLTFTQAEQLAQLAARTGVVWASRAALARMLAIGRRTLDRVLAELDGLVFVTAAVEGRGGGTVLLPVWGRRGDAGPLDAMGRAAIIAGYLRRAGALDLSPAALAAARGLRGVGALVICATTLPAKALRLLAFVLAKLRHEWRRESGQESKNPESLSPTATPNQAGAETPAQVAQEGQEEGLQDGAGGGAGGTPAAPERPLARQEEGAARPVPPEGPPGPPGGPPAAKEAQQGQPAPSGLAAILARLRGRAGASPPPPSKGDLLASAQRLGIPRREPLKPPASSR